MYRGASISSSLQPQPHAPASRVAHVVHVPQQARDGDLSDGLPEEELLDGGLPDGPETRHQQQQTAEARGLARVPRPDVVTQDALGLVLEHLDRLRVTQLSRFYFREGDKTRLGSVSKAGRPLGDERQPRSCEATCLN